MPGRVLLLAAVVSSLLVAQVGTARADDPFHNQESTLTFKVDRPRPRDNRILLWSLLGGSLALGGVGLLFHLDSKDTSDSISSKGAVTGRTYTPEVDEERRAALRSRNLAITGYAAGGGLLIATFVVYLVTDPGTEEITVGEREQARTTVDLIPGGGLVQSSWSF